MIKLLAPGAFQREGRYVQEGPLVACILSEKDDKFSLAVRERVMSVIRSMFRRQDVMLLNSVRLEPALLSIYGTHEGQWVITSVQGALPNDDFTMSHIHMSASKTTCGLCRFLVIYPDAYVDLCVAFIHGVLSLDKIIEIEEHIQDLNDEIDP